MTAADAGLRLPLLSQYCCCGTPNRSSSRSAASPLPAAGPQLAAGPSGSGWPLWGARGLLPPPSTRVANAQTTVPACKQTHVHNVDAMPCRGCSTSLA